MKLLHLEMIRVTESAAIAASTQVGRGDKYAADLAATKAMLSRFNKIDFAGEVVIGEGKKDSAPGLFPGDKVGKGWAYEISPDGHTSTRNLINESELYDIAIDPLDGTTQTAKGGYEAMSVLAIGKTGSLLRSENWYMQKLAVGPNIAQKVKLNIKDSISNILHQISIVLNKDVARITVCVLDRPRHTNLIEKLRKTGCRIKLIQDCDVSAAIATAIPDSGIDLYMGIGGAPEGVIGAAALKCLQGDFSGYLCDKDGNSVDDVIYSTEDLAKGDVVFCATGVTDGSLLKGVRWTSTGPITHSLLMRSESGTVRWITANHGN